MSATSLNADDVEAILASIHQSPLATIVTDNRQADNPIVAANEPFTLLTGYPRDEILGRNCRFLAGRGTEPEARAALREAVMAADCAVSAPPKVAALTPRRIG